MCHSRKADLPGTDQQAASWRTTEGRHSSPLTEVIIMKAKERMYPTKTLITAYFQEYNFHTRSVDQHRAIFSQPDVHARSSSKELQEYGDYFDILNLHGPALVNYSTATVTERFNL